MRRAITRWLCAIATAIGLVASLMVTRAGADEADHFPTTTPIKHLVIIFQENETFDHYFGTYPVAANPPGEPPFVPNRDTPSVNGLTPTLLNFNPNGVNPFRYDRTQAVTCDGDNNYMTAQLEFDLGLMDQFVTFTKVPAGCPDYGHGSGFVMGYFDGNTVTALWNYAQHFAMSDNSYGTTFGSTLLGHINLVSGQTNGAIATPPNSQIVLDGTLVANAQPTGDVCFASAAQTVQMSGTNLGDLLNAKGISWGSFEGGFNLETVNPNGTTGCNRSHTNPQSGMVINDYNGQYTPFQYYPQTSNLTHIRPSSVSEIGHSGQANHEYDVDDLLVAARAGNLPAVSYVKAVRYQTGRPGGISDPLDEQVFLAQTINALEKTRQWKSMAIIIAFDDSDGVYDHQMSPIFNGSTSVLDALSGTGICGSGDPSLGAAESRCGYGPRLPLLVISPYARRNFVDHTITDQTSITRFVEDNWSLGRIGGGSFDAIAGPLSNMFDFSGRRHTRPLFLDPDSGEPR
ncbi:MAG TPA: alkaline phosphatase family protein [Candidatus Acidoferrales bacterium]|nr:alkaline phosphatase family protein [Candidatus Acidoferrales bacterium]